MAPLPEFQKHIRPQQQINFRAGILGLNRAYRITGVALLLLPQLQIGNRKFLLSPDCQSQHGKPLFRRGIGHILARGLPGGHQQEPVKPQLFRRVDRALDMPHMGRIERTSENADFFHFSLPLL